MALDRTDASRLKIEELDPSQQMKCQKGYLNIHHVVVDINKKKIGSFEVTG
jgi:hypothetical protein